MISLPMKPRKYISFIYYLKIPVYLTAGIIALNGYFQWDVTSICGLLLLPLIFRIDSGNKSLRYLPLALVSGVLALYFPVKTCLFLAALFALLFFCETWNGKINQMTIFTLLTISPVVKVFINTFCFPLKLGLSELAAKMISLSGYYARAEGNIIILNGDAFSVDQACTGLNMLGMSLIICFFLITHWENAMNKRISAIQILMLIIFCLLFNLLGNLIRILLLAQFRIMPDNIYHDVIGVICLICYIIIPLVAFSKYFVSRKGRTPGHIRTNFSGGHLLFSVHIILFLLILYVSTHLTSMDSLKKMVPVMRLNGYSREVMDNNIVKFENETGLVYFKPCTFYAPDHDPRICWQGSGYEFKSIKKMPVSNNVVYTGILSKGDDVIYSAWWFDSGHTKTVNQLEWRWKACKSKEDFYLVNVNAQTEVDLKRIVNQIISKEVAFAF